MLDVSRHFFTKAEVKKFMDDMVKFKFNLLHLHLTDDEGWRIEIKSLPKLTSVGAWRIVRNGKWSNSPKAADDKEDIYANKTAWNAGWPDVEEQNRQNGQSSKSLNIDSHTVGLGVFGHLPSLIGDCYEQS